MPSQWRERAVGGALALAAIVWLATLYTAYSLAETQSGGLRDALPVIAIASGPLALLGIAWMLFERSSRRHAKRFADTAKAMRSEAGNLEHILGILSGRIEDNRKALSEHAHQLLLLGEDSTMRLAEIATMMRSETETLAVHSEKLEQAASNARNDMGVLIADVPRIEEQIRTLAEVLRDAGLGAHERAGALEAQLVALAARGREADEHAGGAAQRLAAHLARIESHAENAGQQMDSAAERMNAAVENALAGAAEAIDDTRRGLETQSAALRAMVEQSNAAMDRAGSDAAIALNRRIEEIGGRLDSLATRLRAQDSASQAMIGGLDKGLEDIEQRIGALGEAGGATSGRIAAALAELGDQASRMSAAFVQGDETIGELGERVDRLQGALDAAQAMLNGALPQALGRVEQYAEQSRAAIAASLPEAERLEASIAAAASKLGETDAILIRQRAVFDAIGEDALARLAEIERQSNVVAELFRTTDESARELAERAGPQLVDALLRVRETAVQAAARAREALMAVIPEAAASLGEASRVAMEEAFDDRVEQQMLGISAASERAMQAAHRASERLMRQMLTIADTTSAIEARIEEHKATIAADDEDNLARRLASLIESLNSTAIDVTKLLSNDVTDTAWAAYLKGDRGVFTRRAVRLLEAGEAREIVRHYESEPEFRDQVNRYIHDFEAMLRRVLATRDGSPLSIALLSSDIGKLYVALAQAIERLRT